MKMKNRALTKNVVVIVCFVLVSLLCHISFLGADGYSFIGSGSDGTSQMLTFTSFLEQNWANGNFWWSWNYGIGGDIFSEFSYYYTTSIFFIIRFIIKVILGIDFDNLILTVQWKLFWSILKQTLAMTGMYFFLKYDKEAEKTTWEVIGSIIYSTGIWYLHYSLNFDYMTDAIVWLPIVCLGIKKYRKKRQSGVLIFSFACMVANSFYFGYMSCLFIGTFVLVDCFEKNITLKKYSQEVMKIVGILILGIGISAVGFLPAVQAFLRSDRQRIEVIYRWLPNLQEVLHIFDNLFLRGSSILTLPYCILIVFLLRWKQVDFETKKRTFLFGIWGLFFLIPAFSSIMNGFSYATDRWYYILLFVAGYVLPAWLRQFDKMLSVPVKKTIILMAAIIFMFFTGKKRGVIITSQYEYVCFAAGILMLLLLVIKRYKRIQSKARYFEKMIVGLVIISAIAHNIGYVHTSGLSLKKETNLDALTYRTSLINGKLLGEEEFARVSNRSVQNSGARMENASLLEDNKGISSYNSLINRNIQEWFKRKYNCYFRFITPSYFNGVGERLFLENALGVKYITHGNEVPYGYEKKQLADGRIVFENQNTVGIDLWYDTIISQTEWESFSIAQRDAAIMQTAVVENNERLYLKEKLDDTVKKIPIEEESVQYENCEIKGNKLIVSAGKTENVFEAERGKIIIKLPKLQLQNEEGEYLFSMNFAVDEQTVLLTPPYAFYMTVNEKDVFKYRSSYNWTYNLDNYSFRIDKDAEEIIIELTSGEYEIENLELYFNSYENLKKWTEERNKYNLKNLKIEKNQLSGTLQNKEAGILALNVPYTQGWTCYVDGKEQKLLKVNGIFSGIELEKGNHEIKLVFFPPYLKSGLAITIVSIGIYVLIIYVKIRNVRKQKKRNKKP